MKKAVFYLSVILFISLTFAIFANEGSNLSIELLTINNLQEIHSKDEYNSLKEDLNKTRNILINIEDNIAYDKDRDTYYASNKNIKINKNPKASVFLFQDKDYNTYNLLAKTDSEYQEIKIIITGTPIVKIEKIKEKRKPMRRPYDKVILTTFDPKPNSKAESYQIKMRPRGRSSMAYEKISYSIKNLDKKEMSIYGMPMNEKYVLNSIYEDEYKIRDVLSWDIWTESSAYQNERNIYNTSEMIYVEVFIDDSYQGMYGLQEYINEYKLGLRNAKGSIIQSDSFSIPKLENFDPYRLFWGTTAVKYSSLPDGEKWFGFEEYIDKFDSLPLDQDFVEENFDITSFIDYYVFTEFISAWDNMWHNLFFSRTTENNKLMITPWDLDQTFGAKWTNELPYLSETDFENVSMIYDESNHRNNPKFFIQRLIDHYDGFEEAAAKRYFQLREDIWTEEKILEKIKSYEDYIYNTGMYRRDLERWPSSPRIKENQEDFISEITIKKMHKLDNLFKEVLEEAEK